MEGMLTGITGQVQVPESIPPVIPLDWALIPPLGLGLFFLVTFLRALPWPEKLRTRKPLSCDVCLTGWLSIMLFLTLSLAQGYPWTALHVLPAAGVALLLLALHARLKVEDLRPPG